MTVVVDVVDMAGLAADHEAAKRLLMAVLEAEGVSGRAVLAFVGEAAMAELNERYRDAEGATDVLAFDYANEEAWPAGIDDHEEAEDDVPSKDAGSDRRTGRREVRGEIVVCPEVVRRYAVADGRDPAVQLGWTIIHGVLHLAGYDHEQDQGEMRERELLLLERLSGPVHALGLVGSGE